MRTQADSFNFLLEIYELAYFSTYAKIILSSEILKKELKGYARKMVS
jgi:hypothetical protein